MRWTPEPEKVSDPAIQIGGRLGKKERLEDWTVGLEVTDF